jgi:tetratricopeptide (TPR) repeat protein
MHEVAHYISSEPLHFIGGLAQKCWLLLGSVEEPRNIDLYTFRARTRSLRPLAWHIGGFGFPFAVVAGLAFCGLVHWRRWGTAQLAVLGWTALYAASVLLFFPAARYRLPLLPPLIALAVAGGYDLVKDWRDGNRLGPLLLLTAGTLLVSWPRRSPTAETSFDAELDRNLGVALQVRGDRDGAIAQYTAALHLDPGDADTMFYLATALRDSGRLEPAREAFESCLAVQPDHERALHDLGVMCYEAGDVEHSAELLRRALDVNPRYVRAMRNLMVAELRLGNTREAEALRQRIEAATIRMPIE